MVVIHVKCYQLRMCHLRQALSKLKMSDRSNPIILKARLPHRQGAQGYCTRNKEDG